MKEKADTAGWLSYQLGHPNISNRKLLVQDLNGQLHVVEWISDQEEWPESPIVLAIHGSPLARELNQSANPE